MAKQFLPKLKALGLYSTREMKMVARYHLGISTHFFVHVPKNAGSAIKATRELRSRIVWTMEYFYADRDHLAALRKTWPDSPRVGHARLIDISPAVRAKLQPFAVIRNPFARMVSRFTYSIRIHEALNGGSLDDSQDAFARFLEERHTLADEPFNWQRAARGWARQVDYLRDETGAIPVHILRQETLNDELSRYFDISKMEKRNRSGKPRRRYQDYYSDTTRQIVADWYADDIETFGFDFEGGATRNTYFS